MQRLTPGSQQWRDKANALLQEGYGSQDIAVLMDCRPDQVSAHIAALRSAGKLARWWPKPAVAAE